jgi:CBS domain containing-hemolysin-like protein
VIIDIVTLVGLVLLNSYFVAAEFALVRARPTRLDALARGGDGLAALALRATKQIPLVLSACQTGVTLCGLGLGWVAEDALMSGLAGWLSGLPIGISVSLRVTIATIIAFLVVTFITVVFGELTPKNVALNNPERWARYLIPPLLAFAWVTKPFTWLLNRSSQMVLRLLNQKPMESEESVHSPEELRMLVEQSEESGALEKEDAAMIDAVFEFSEKNAREVMTPRTEIEAIEVSATFEEVIQFVSESGRSRIPVYEETIDDIIGVLLVKDLIPVLRNPPEPFSLRALIRPPHFVPGTREVEDVLADFKHRKEHMAIVLDEYGGTAGIVTMEDLLEEIVGEILDEYDEPIDTAVLTITGETLLPGNTNISELNEAFGTEVPEEEGYTTIGGYVFGMLGHLPVVGDWVKVGDATFTVREMEGRRIAMLAMTLTSATPNDDSGSQSQHTSTPPQ